MCIGYIRLVIQVKPVGYPKSVQLQFKHISKCSECKFEEQLRARIRLSVLILYFLRI